MRRRLWLCLPPLVMCLIDDAITLRAQPDVYWSGLWHEGFDAKMRLIWKKNRARAVRELCAV